MNDKTDCLRILDIVELIKNDANKNLETILKYIANLFGADDAIFTHCKNIICKNKYIENMCKQTVTIEYCDSDNIFPEIPEKNNIKSLMATPVFLGGKPFSILQLHYKKQHRHFHKNEIVLFERIASILSSQTLVLSETEEKFIGSFVLMMEARDIYTKGHSQRVAIYSKKIAESIGLDENEQFKLYIAGIVHDIGKIGIPDAILLKPGKLTQEEYKIIKYHSEFSYQIIKDISKFEQIANFVRYHHERYDGSGYPKGLEGEEIPLGARILAIADVFDAITTSRPYRRPLNVDEAIDAMSSMEGCFDSKIFKKVRKTLKDSFVAEENSVDRNFMPQSIDITRKEIFTKDFMTGLLTRKSFVENVEYFIKSGTRFFMFYVDIKNLSKINYNYSMGVGDSVILHTADTLKKIKTIKFVARTQPDVFYFVYSGRIQPEKFAGLIKGILNREVVKHLSKEEMKLDSWYKVIDFYISFSVFIPGKSVEDMMYECRQRKKEMEFFLEE